MSMFNDTLQMLNKTITEKEFDSLEILETLDSK